jgi:hypothetical protein
VVAKNITSAPVLLAGPMLGRQTDSYNHTTPKMKKKGTETWCKNNEINLADGDGNGYTTSCSLK